MDLHRRLIFEQPLNGFAEPGVPFHPRLISTRDSDRRGHQQRASDAIDTGDDLAIAHVGELERARSISNLQPCKGIDAQTGATAVAMGCRPRGLPGPAGVTIHTKAQQAGMKLD